MARGGPPSLKHQPGRLSGGTAEAAGHIVGQAAAAEVDPNRTPLHTVGDRLRGSD